MKIIQLSNAFNWSGGAEQMLLASRELASRGHDLWVICSPNSPMEERARKSGLQVWPLVQRQDYDVPAMIRLSRFIKDHQIEILHANHPKSHAIGLGAAYFSKVPVFCVSRRVIFRIRKNPFSRLKYLSSRVNHYIAISSAVKPLLVEAGVSDKRVTVIPSAVHLPSSLENTVRSDIRTRWNIPTDAQVIGAVSNHAPFKGLIYLIEAAALARKRGIQAYYLIVGRDTEQLTSLVKERKLEDIVRLAGFQNQPDRYLAAMDVYVLPSLEEAAGTAMREAMIRGLPAIGTNVGGIPDSIHHEKTGLLVPPANAEELSRAIERFSLDSVFRKRMAQAGQRFMEEHFTIPKAIDQLEALYKRLLAEKR